MYQQRRNVLIAHAIKSKKHKVAANVQEVDTLIEESVVEPVTEQEAVAVEPEVAEQVAGVVEQAVELVVEVTEPVDEPKTALKVLNPEQKVQRKARAKKS